MGTSRCWERLRCQKSVMPESPCRQQRPRGPARTQPGRVAALAPKPMSRQCWPSGRSARPRSPRVRRRSRSSPRDQSRTNVHCDTESSRRPRGKASRRCHSWSRHARCRSRRGLHNPLLRMTHSAKISNCRPADHARVTSGPRRRRVARQDAHSRTSRCRKSGNFGAN